MNGFLTVTRFVLLACQTPLGSPPPAAQMVSQTAVQGVPESRARGPNHLAPNE